jgi:hypothetical protein
VSLPASALAWLRWVALAAAISVISFAVLGGIIHWWFYVRQRARAREWKL